MKRGKVWFLTTAAACAGVSAAVGCSHEVVNGPSASSCADPGCGTFAFSDAGGPSTSPSAVLRPSFAPTVVASKPPPPISGGTLLVTRDGKTAVAADPDRDAVYGVDLAGTSVRFTVLLKPGDEPGRLVEDGAGRIHVALRGSGALATIDPTSGTLIARRNVCPAPRGVAWDGASDNLLVACATGELVTLPAAGGAATSSVHVERDLRDVMVYNGAVSVSSFRSAEVLRLDTAGGGTVTRRDALVSPDPGFIPHVAWRTVLSPSGSVVAVHQAETTSSLSTTVQGGYGGGGFGGALVGPPPPPDDTDGGLGFPGDSNDSGFLFTGGGEAGFGPLPPPFEASSAVMSVLTVLAPDGAVLVNETIGGVLPVDVAVSPDGSNVAAVTPGSAFTPLLNDVFIMPAVSSPNGLAISLSPTDQPIAVAFAANDMVVVQTREPARLWLVPTSGVAFGPILLSYVSRDDTGHDVFHTQAGAQIACASCHPEGGDDGHVWVLDNNQRRTPSLRGTIAGTAPYHWPGDEPDLPTLVNDVYTVRMSGVSLPPDQMGALTGWVQTIPKPPAPTWVDESAASLGKTLFERADTKCSSCHTGASFTNNATVDVGTGGKFQVPPLVGVGWRTPLMHDGCAATIADRLTKCQSAQHGDLSNLSAQDVTNLTAYLETL